MTIEQQLINAGRQADSEHPERLRTNRNVDCFEHTSRVLEILGEPWAYVGKTAHEGQYSLPGMTAFTATGRDGKVYVITGVSHDAITNGPLVYDLLGAGNDGPEPLGSPATVQAMNVPPEYHRPNNPPVPYPLKGASPAPSAPPPLVISLPAYPGDLVFDTIGAALFEDYAAAGNAPDPQMGRWFGRVTFDWLVKNTPTLEASILKHRREWRLALGLPTV